MFKRTMMVGLLAGLVGLAFTTAVVACGHGPASVGITGQLTKIDGKTLTITMGKGTKNTVITCNDATKISRKGDKSGTQAKFEDLQVGQAVRAYYTKADNVAVAVIIVR